MVGKTGCAGYPVGRAGRKEGVSFGIVARGVFDRLVKKKNFEVGKQFLIKKISLGMKKVFETGSSFFREKKVSKDSK